MASDLNVSIMFEAPKACLGHYSYRLDHISLAVLDHVDYYGRGRIITRINVPSAYRGLGVGSYLLNKIMMDAALAKVNLYLEIMPSDGLNYAQLRSWYERYGFTNTSGIYIKFWHKRKAYGR